MTSPVFILQIKTTGIEKAMALTIKCPTVGEPQGEFVLPYIENLHRQAVIKALDASTFDPLEWEDHQDTFNILQALELADKQGFREDMYQRIGQELKGKLLNTDGLVEAMHETIRKSSMKQPARLELRFSAKEPSLCAYPWELLYDEDREEFLFSGMRVTLVRYITCELPVPHIPEADQLNLVLLKPRPSGLPVLPDYEEGVIEKSLEDLTRQGRLQITVIQDQNGVSTWDMLDQLLVKAKRAGTLPHVLHIDTHGGFGRLCKKPGCNTLNKSERPQCASCDTPLREKPQGYLAFTQGDKKPDWINANRLGNRLINTGIRLVVMTSCRSAVVDGQSVFTGMAPAMIQAGIPAVVAMQFSISAKAAADFTKTFYGSVGQGEPITTAISQARAYLYDDPAWYRPVLYLRVDDKNPEGHLFRFRPGRPSEKEAPIQPKRPVLDIIPEQADPTYTLGNEDTVDNQKIIDELIAMLNGAVKFRVLAIQGLEKEGIDALVQRMQKVCAEKTASKGQVYVPCSLRSGWSTVWMIKQMLDAIAVNITPNEQLAALAGKVQKYSDDLMERLHSMVRVDEKQRLRVELTKICHDSLVCITDVCPMVLLFDSLELVAHEESGDFLLNAFMDEALGLPDLQVILTASYFKGTEGPLKCLDRRGSNLIRFANLVKMDFEDFNFWVRYVKKMEIEMVPDDILRDCFQGNEENPTKAWLMIKYYAYGRRIK